jgi:hypothetical protein
LEAATTRSTRRTAFSITTRRTRGTHHARSTVFASITTRTRLTSGAGFSVFAVFTLFVLNYGYL